MSPLDSVRKDQSKSSVIQVVYQPDQSKTLSDAATRQIHLTVSSYQYWGMLLMAYALFGGNDDHIQFRERPRASTGSVKPWRLMKLAYLNSMIGPYVIAQDPTYRPNRPSANWNQYLASFAQTKPFDPNEFIEFTGHLIGRSEVMVRFPDLEFLQGAILICLWFNLSVSDYIHNLKYNWRPFRIVPTDILSPSLVDGVIHSHLERHYHPEPIGPNQALSLINHLQEPPIPEDVEITDTSDVLISQFAENYIN